MYLSLWVVEKEADEHQSHFETHQPEHDDTGDDQAGPHIAMLMTGISSLTFK